MVDAKQKGIDGLPGKAQALHVKNGGVAHRPYFLRFGISGFNARWVAAPRKRIGGRITGSVADVCSDPQFASWPEREYPF